MTKPMSMTDILKDITKKSDLRLGSLSDVAEDVTWLNTGNLGINYVAGHGLPLGRSIELYGLESSGKTTTALQTAADLQREIIATGRDEYILYLDYEHAFDPDYTAALGLDEEHPSFILGQPYSMEQGAESALKIIATGKVRLVIWDSVAAMAPIARIDGEFDQRTAAMNKARLMSGLMLQLTPLLHKHNCTSVFINHLMEKVDMGASRPGLPPKSTTPGGKALKYYASVRLEFRQIGNAKTKGVDPLSGDPINKSIATQVKVKCVKNKVADPLREAEVRIRHGKGFDNTWSALQVMLAHKKIIKEGAWYRFDTTKVPGLVHPDMTVSSTRRPSLNGESGVLRFADTHTDWRTQLITEATAIIDAHGTGTDPSDEVDTSEDDPED